MKVRFSSPAEVKSGAMIVLAGAGPQFGPFAEAADTETQGLVGRAAKAADFTGKKGQHLDLIAPSGLAVDRLLVFGLGDEKNGVATSKDSVDLGGTIAGALIAAGATQATIRADVPAGQDGDAFLADIALGMRLRCYRFDRHKSKKETSEDDDDKKPDLRQINFQAEKPTGARRQFAARDAIAEGVHIARDLTNEPANILTPSHFAKRLKKFEKAGLSVDVLGEKELNRLGMGALLAVGMGSRQESHVVVLRHDGGGDEAPIAIVGKGVTFDSGGISMKPPAGMDAMKGDMAGASCVAGLMHTLASRKAKVNAVGLVGLVENMVNGKAQRPGDIVTSMSGKTIEVLNTDAEGRLVLADVLHYARQTFNPKAMIDLATLTGAIIVALGKHHAGLFSNDDALSDQLVAAGQATGERVWRMPLDKAYDKMLASDNADMKNIGGREAGAITAAQFLQRFVGETPWAHLDIAGTGMSAPKSAINPSWGSGYGVRLLDRLIAEHFEVS